MDSSEDARGSAGKPEARQPPSVVDQLRDWAAGTYSMSAAVEVLVGFESGWLAQSHWPWIRGMREDRAWFDAKEVTEAATRELSSESGAVLTLVASLVRERPIHLGEVMSNIDAGHLPLILNALAHAARANAVGSAAGDGDTPLTLVVLPSVTEWTSG